MSHPHNEHRQHKVEKRRVGHITKGYASGGAVKEGHYSEENDKKGAEKSVKSTEVKAEGKLPKHRTDRKARGGEVLRARGGRTKAKGHTTVNVVVPHGGGGGMMPPGGLAGPAGPPMMPPRPPVAPPIPAAGGLPPGAMPPPGMPPGGPIRHSGGRAFASGGRVKDGPAWKEGLRNGTQVANSPGKNDTKNIGRDKVVTYKTGGAVESPEGVAPATKLPGGSGGGEARLAKEKRYHGKPGGLYS